MRVVVIGSEGNIGRHLCRHLRTKGHYVFEVDWKPGYRKDYLTADINAPIDLLPVFEDGVDLVILLAAMVSRVTCEFAPGLAVETNLVGLNNIISLCKRYQSRLMYFSTSEVYGNKPDLRLDEATTIPSPNNLYGLTKYLGEQLVEYNATYCGLSALTVRPFMIYNADETDGDHRSAIGRFVHHLARGEPVTVHAGSARGWLYIDDAVEIISLLAEYRGQYTVVNIGNEDVRMMSDIPTIIQQYIPFEPTLVTVRDLPEQMTLIKYPALMRQARLTGYTPKVCLEEGIRRLCEYTRGKA